MLKTVKGCGKGVNLDLLPSELDDGQWSDALNMRFRNDFAEKFKGIQAAFTTPVVTPYWLTTYVTSTGRFLIEAGLSAVYADDGLTQTNITGTTVPTGAIDDRWNGGVLNGVLVMNNGVNAPVYWNGNVANKLATLTGWTAGYTSDVIRPFKNYLICLGNTWGGVKRSHGVAWSAAAEPGALPATFTASATNAAGDVDLAETTGVMVDCLPMGDVNIIYKQDARYAMQLIGGNSVFRFSRLPGNDGLLARGCVVNTPKGHVFLSNGDVKIHNGGEATSIADGRIRMWLFSLIDSVNGKRAFLSINPKKSEVWVVFPSTGQTACNTVAAWNWESDTWGIRSVSGVTFGTTGQISLAQSETWASDSETWNLDVTAWLETEYSQNESRLIISTTTPRIGLAEAGATDFGQLINWRLERSGLNFEDVDTVKMLRSSRPQMDAVDGVTFNISHGSAMTANGAARYSKPVNYTVGVDNFANSFSTAGRHLAFKMEGNDPQLIRLRSFDIDYVIKGRV